MGGVKCVGMHDLDGALAEAAFTTETVGLCRCAAPGVVFLQGDEISPGLHPQLESPDLVRQEP